MLHRLRKILDRDEAIHLAGAQLALVLVMSAGLAIAAAPTRHATRLMSARLAPSAAAAAQVQPAAGAPGPDAPVIRLQDLSPDAARRWNAANPVSTTANPPARPFKLNAAGVLDEARAVDCLTAAVYYEAGHESLEGQRAVAQVVLNRMRHPAFPKTVCGVVFQGAERTSGCQFTFACDGALGRTPSEEGWARARKVAEAALDGYVMKKVGEATHYHADYVAPYWSPTLVKVATLSAHIFYRWTGGWGSPPAFAGRYAGGETAGLRVATLDNLARSSARGPLAADAAALAAPVATPVVVAEADAPRLAADKAEPELITAASVAKDAQAVAKAEDLDWQGRPRGKAPPRLAMPSGGL